MNSNIEYPYTACVGVKIICFWDLCTDHKTLVDNDYSFLNVVDDTLEMGCLFIQFY